MHLGQVSDEETLARHRAAMAQRQVVVDPDFMAARQKVANGVTANVAGPAGDEDAHGLFFVREVLWSNYFSGPAGDGPASFPSDIRRRRSSISRRSRSFSASVC